MLAGDLRMRGRGAARQLLARDVRETNAAALEQLAFLEDAGGAAAAFRASFGNDYGLTLVDGPLRGLTARAVLVLDENDKVLVSQLVPEIASEPDYAAVSNALGR